VKITDFLTEEAVIPALTAREKNAVLKEMATGLVANHPALDEKKVLEVLLERERISQPPSVKVAIPWKA
jgi:PTS system nitrogen regulatory IIA component